MCVLMASPSSSGASEADPASWAWTPTPADADPANTHQVATATLAQAVVVSVRPPADQSRPRSWGFDPGRDSALRTEAGLRL